MRSPRPNTLGPLQKTVGYQPSDLLWHTGSRVLVYLIHGITGTPVEMHYLGRALARHGWNVYATTLPGHCTHLRNLIRTSEETWLNHIQRQLTFLRDRYSHLLVAGLSASALLALESSTAVPLEGIGVFSPTLVYDGWNIPWTRQLFPLAKKTVPKPLQWLFFHLDGPPYGIKNPVLQERIRAAYHPMGVLHQWAKRQWRCRGKMLGDRPRLPRAASKGYSLFPLKTLLDIDRLIDRVRPRMPLVTAPTVILHAIEDDMTSPRNAYEVYHGIASEQKELVLLEDCFHVITVDNQRQAVAQHVIDFFENQINRGSEVPPLKSSSGHH